MNSIILPADSTTLVLNGTAINDMQAGDSIVFTPVNAATSRINNLNSVTIQERADARVYDITVNVEKLSDSDIFLNGYLNTSPPQIIDGSSKTIYLKNGVEAIETYSIQAGSMTTKPTDTKNNQDGNAMLTYTFQAIVTRLL